MKQVYQTSTYSLKGLCCALFLLSYAYAQHTLTLENGGFIVADDQIQIVLDNVNWQQDGAFIPDSSTVIWQGNETTHVSGNGAPAFYRATVDKSHGAVRLGADMSLTHRWLFNQGNIDLHGQELSLGNTGALIMESETSRVLDSLGGGSIVAWATLNAPSQDNPGNLGAELSSTANLGLTEIRRSHTLQTISGSNSILRYFDITPTHNTNLNATLRIHYFEAELGGLTETAFELWESSDAGLTWTSLTGSQHNLPNNWVQASGIQSFARTSITNNASLPVTWIGLEANWETKAVRLDWQVMQDQQTYAYLIQRRLDGDLWTLVDTVIARPTEQGIMHYQFRDLTLNYQRNQVFTYRIRQVDLDGATNYSPVVSLYADQLQQDWLTAHPNPVHDLLNVQASLAQASDARIVLTNAYGQLMYEEYVTGKLLLQTQIDTRSFPQGVYTLTVQTQAYPLSRKVHIAH